ncbi:hypothetical protein PCANC_12425 [Puccinia coronata f. sp. avenae]|uniref:50S ribosomal protein L35 n=1 Tax=Puccinia coronata f. sp. avenae TaxID=200324 RepID=A0A2N5VBB4_9BASI|nr:hypothetical protein PCANC_12425 [Puccinia coronata f. sp. avenae]
MTLIRQLITKLIANKLPTSIIRTTTRTTLHKNFNPRLTAIAEPQPPQTRNFSASSSNEWKSIGTVKKNRKTRSKLKTHQGASKRFFVTGRGQFKRVQAGTQHLMTGTHQSRKRKLKPMIIINKSQTSLMRKLLPYAGKRAGFRKLDQSETVWWKSGKLQKSGLALSAAIKRSHQLKHLEVSTAAPPP